MKPTPANLFRQHGGQLRMSEAIARGISRYRLYALRDRGIIEPVSRGVWRLVELPPIGNPDLVTVSLRFPKAVICLVSALVWHELTTQVPREVSVAVARDARLPARLFSSLSFSHLLDLARKENLTKAGENPAAFVSRYLVALPSEDQLKTFLRREQEFPTRQETKGGDA